jgi:ribosome-associated toxin RatA of RatAB toxin-antitoxin module
LRSRIDIDVRAPAEKVLELVRDVVHWPELLPHYRKVTVLSRNHGEVVATMTATRSFGPIKVPVAWRSRTWAETDQPDDLRLRFVHVRGATRGMDVTWHITPRAGGCNVAIDHDFVRPLPFVGEEAFPRLVDRVFVRPIAGRTLATFKELAEEAARGETT